MASYYLVQSRCADHFTFTLEEDDGNCCEKNYKDVCNPRLPRAKWTQHDLERLYPLEVLERDGACVKVHYVGYSSTHDEWRDVEEIVTTESEEQQQRSVLQMEAYHPLDMHR